MGRRLTRAQIEHYHREGYLSPIRVFDRARAAGLRARMEACEARFGALEIGKGGSRAHLLWTWVDEVVHDPAVLDVIEDVIGPDIRVYTVTIWAKPAGDPAFVDWHQDASYFGLDPMEQVTAWVALSDASEESGCMNVIPRSHEIGLMHHSVKEAKAGVRTMLPRGQSITTGLDLSTAVSMPLAAGEISLHHTLAIHGSGPNRSPDRRIGIGVSYIPAHVRFIGTSRLSAMLVRGTDRHHHFDDEPRPQADCDEAARAAHQAICARYFASKRELEAQYQPIDLSA